MGLGLAATNQAVATRQSTSGSACFATTVVATAAAAACDHDAIGQGCAALANVCGPAATADQCRVAGIASAAAIDRAAQERAAAKAKVAAERAEKSAAAAAEPPAPAISRSTEQTKKVTPVRAGSSTDL